MREEQARPDVAPRDAFVRSLVFPGLGHRLVGRPLEGLARGILFTMLVLMAVLVGLSGTRAPGLRLLFILYAGAAIVVYLGSAFEARRLAEGGDPFATAKQILWATVAVVLVSVGMLAVTVITTAKR